MEQGFANCTYMISLSHPPFFLLSPSPTENQKPYQDQVCIFIYLNKFVMSVHLGSRRVNCWLCAFKNTVHWDKLLGEGDS